MAAWHSDDADVGVIMPHYDCAPYVAQAVQSILAQQDVSLRLVFVDDRSPSDDWKTALAPFLGDPRLVVLQTSRNVGPWRIGNWLFQCLRTPYIAFQDADDFSAPDRLRRQLDALEARRADIVGSAFYEISEAGEIQRLKTMPRHVNWAIARGHDHSILHGASLMRRSVLDRLGGFDGTDHHLGADTDFALRASFAARIRNVARPLYYYRQRAKSLTRAAATGIDSAVRATYRDRILREHRARRAAWWKSLLANGPPPSLGNVPNDVDFDIAGVPSHETRGARAVR
jgi:glycosyltransferase involved in cell wall biosynthesis